jgi:hypothetical protein
MVEQLVNAVAVFGGNGKQGVKAQLIELLRQQFALRNVDLVDRHRYGLSEAAQQCRQLAIGGGEFAPAVDQEHDLAGLFQRQARLFENFARDDAVLVGKQPAGVDEFEPLALVLGDAADPVARDAGLIADDRPPAPDDAIEQGGLADVGPADDHDRRQALGALHSTHMIASGSRAVALARTS